MAPKVAGYYFRSASPFAALPDALVEEVGADLDPTPLSGSKPRGSRRR